MHFVDEFNLLYSNMKRFTETVFYSHKAFYNLFIFFPED